MESWKGKDRRIAQYQRETDHGKKQGDAPGKPTGNKENGALTDRGTPEGFLKSHTGGGYKKAAKLLLLLGSEEASRIMSHLSDEELTRITAEIAAIKKVAPEDSAKLLKEFGDTEAMHRFGTGGPEVAQQMLTHAFGEERARAILSKTLPKVGRRPFDFLADVEGEQLISLLKNEPPSVLSTVLPYLDPAKAGIVLTALDSKAQRQTVKRIAGLNKIVPEVLEKIEEALKARLKTQGKITTQEIDGSSVLAGILKEMDYSSGETLLSELEETNPRLGEEVRKKVLTIDVVLKLSDQELQTVLRDFDDGELAVIMKGKSDEIKDRILSCVSARRRIIIAEEIIHLGSMRKSDVDKATGEFMDYIRGLERQNKIVIRKENDYLI